MPRTADLQPRKRRNDGEPKESYAESYAKHPHGSRVIRLSNQTLAHLERIAAEHALTVPQYLDRLV